MYRSILDQRQETIDAQAFEAAPRLVFNHYAAGEKPDDYTLGLWEKFIPYAPSQIYGLFADGYQQQDVVVKVGAYETGRLEFEIDHLEEDGFRSSLVMRMGRNPQILGSVVTVDPEAQGKGTGRNTMRNWIETAAAFGFPEFVFDAAKDDGGFVWAKMGAHLDRNEERHPFYQDDEESLSRSMCARLETARPFIGNACYEEARSLCRIQRPDDLVRLSAMGDIVIPREAVERSAVVIPEYFMNVLGDTKDCARVVRAEVANISSIFSDAGRGLHENVSLPAFLQKQTVWAAVVDFSNETQMERVGDYAGGWQTIAPVRVPAMA